jgi:hypothetical protein
MTLAEEAQRYLAVVETFRAQGCEPHWRRETSLERAHLSDSCEGPGGHGPSLQLAGLGHLAQPRDRREQQP